ncbi:hypothetical protein [Sphingopyxis sp.]|jgi:hypothetical protein|uniref:hypothetical protein n=1 Tax=Sphingopyxis sp. TaxID=1908224 RepID=UPI00311EA939
MFIVEPMVVVVAVCATVIFMHEMPRLFALLIVRIAGGLSAARHTQIVEALSGRQVPANWTATSEDRKLLRAAMRSTMRVAMFRSLYPLNRWNRLLGPF